MPASDYPSLFIGASEGRVAQYTRAIQLLEEGLKRGSIANAVYENDIKLYLSRAIEHAWGKAVRDTFPYQEASEEDRKLHWTLPSSPQMHRLDSYLRAIEKSGLDTEYSRAARMFLTEIKPLCEGVVSLKALAVKRQPKPESERKVTYTAPKTSTVAEKAILETLRAVTDAQYEPLKARIVARYTHALDTFMAQADTLLPPTRGIPYERYADAHSFFMGEDRPFTVVPSADGERRVQKPHDIEAYEVVRDCVERANHRSPWARKADAAETIERMATGLADLIRETFITKNMLKLVAITEAKGNFEKIETLAYREPDLSGLNGAFKVYFTDSARFEISMQVVYAISTRGKRFYRVPVTFHEVVFPNGQRMKQPSEKKMNEIFVAAAA